MSILLASATEAEILPTLEWLRTPAADKALKQQLRICITGVGLMATTYELTRELSTQSADLVVGAGIAGAFKRDIILGECVIVRSEQIADFGAEDGDAFLDAFGMELVNGNESPFSNGRLVNPLNHLPGTMSTLRQVNSLSVMKVSGRESSIEERITRYRADIEGMEGAALHYVCGRMATPYVQLRSISNYVTRRDRSAWKIPEAIAALNTHLQNWLLSLA